MENLVVEAGEVSPEVLEVRVNPSEERPYALDVLRVLMKSVRDGFNEIDRWITRREGSAENGEEVGGCARSGRVEGRDADRSAPWQGRRRRRRAPHRCCRRQGTTGRRPSRRRTRSPQPRKWRRLLRVSASSPRTDRHRHRRRTQRHPTMRMRTWTRLSVQARRTRRSPRAPLAAGAGGMGAAGTEAGPELAARALRWRRLAALAAEAALPAAPGDVCPLPGGAGSSVRGAPQAQRL